MSDTRRSMCKSSPIGTLPRSTRCSRARKRICWRSKARAPSPRSSQPLRNESRPPRSFMVFESSTRDVPAPRQVPRHIAIIMDGNGRWAKQRMLPRVAGHRKGVEAVRTTVRACIERGVDFLTLFAFSSENWRRPADEVSILMQLFVRALEQEAIKLHDNGIRFKVIGDTSRFEPKIRELIAGGEKLTEMNLRLMLIITAKFGGLLTITQDWDTL